MNPRPTPKRSKFFLLFGLFWAIFSLPFILIGYNFWKDEARYLSHGVAITGSLYAKTTSQSTDSHGKHSTNYIARYKFKNAKGELVEGESYLDYQKWNNLNEGDPVDVEYVGEDAALNRIKQDADFTVSYIFGGVGSLCFIIGLVFIVVEYRQRSKIKRISQSGIIASATITSVAPGNLTVNGVTQWVIHYTYQDYHGTHRTGTTEYLSPDEASSWKHGDKVQIKFDPNNSAESIWFGNL